MKRKMYINILITVMIMVTILGCCISVSAYSACNVGTYSFTRNYSASMGCSMVNATRTLSDLYASTSMSTPNGCNMETYVAVWNSGGQVNSAVHNGYMSTSSATTWWLVFTPVRSFHSAICEDVPGCNGYHCANLF